MSAKGEYEFYKLKSGDLKDLDKKQSALQNLLSGLLE